MQSTVLTLPTSHLENNNFYDLQGHRIDPTSPSFNTSTQTIVICNGKKFVLGKK